VILSVPGWRKQPDPTRKPPVTTSAITYTTPCCDSIEGAPYLLLVTVERRQVHADLTRNFLSGIRALSVIRH
jgi:hypothetical protein